MSEEGRSGIQGELLEALWKSIGEGRKVEPRGGHTGELHQPCSILSVPACSKTFVMATASLQPLGE